MSMVFNDSSIHAWTYRLAAILENCSETKPEQQHSLFSLAIDAIADAPIPFLTLTGLNPSHPQIASYLACNAFESAALIMLGTEAVYMLSRGNDGMCIASVILPGMANDVSSSGKTEGLAIVSATISAILSLYSLKNAIPIPNSSTSLHWH